MKRLNFMMGLALAALPAAAPTWAAAEDFVIASRVVAATLYPDGGSLERSASFDVPAGTHDLLIGDLPVQMSGDFPRLTVSGAVMGTVRLRTDYVPPRDEGKSAVIAAAEDAVTAAEAELAAAEDARADALLARDAGEARLQFLAKLGQGDAPQPSGELRALSQMIGEETAAARQSILVAERAARALEPRLEDLREALAKAEAALAALDTEAGSRAFLAVTITAEEAAQGTVTLRYAAQDMRWAPVYDIHLTRGDAPKIVWDRFAVVTQSSGEDWNDVALTLSTVRPSGQTDPREVYAQQLRIEDPAVAPMVRKLAAPEAMNDMAMSGMAVSEAPVLMEPVAAQMGFDGISYTYRYPSPVSIANNADNLRIGMGRLEAKAGLIAQAVPRFDQTAFLVAEFTNDSGELILPSGMSSLYLDGTFVGRRSTQIVASGGESSLSFGPLEGLRLTYHVLGSAEGDRGVISKSNRREESVRMSVENLTAQAWDMRLIDRVPYSEQEDLKITWRASRTPSEQDIDGKRGVMAWEFEVPAGKSDDLELETVITWPEGKELR